jgi:hypothetical protein
VECFLLNILLCHRKSALALTVELEGDIGIPQCVGNISVGELNGLQALYNSTNGAEWKWGSAGAIWTFPSMVSDPCGTNTWQGLQCTRPTTLVNGSNCLVTEVTLLGYNLVGTIPSTITYLQSLVVLDLNTNKLHSTIPPEVWSLSVLEVINVAGNHITGTLPTDNSTVKLLRLLLLSDNYFTGGLSASFLKTAPYLENFDVANNNYLTGPLPDELGSLVYLTRLSMLGNIFTGSIPVGLYSDEMMSELTLSFNLLTGSIPSAVGGMIRVTELSLGDNFITGSFPLQMYSLKALTVGIFASAWLSGTIAPDIRNLTQLHSYTVEYNMLDGILPEGIYELSSVVYLYLGLNSLSGTISQSLSNLNKLVALAFNDNYFSGSIPSMEALSQLTTVDFSENLFTGPLPQSLESLTVLQSVSMTGNIFTGTISSQLQLLSTVTLLSFGNNYLSGSMPSQLSECTSLQALFLNSNFLSGTVPPQTAQIGSLISLNNSDNMFSGTIEALFDDESALANLVYFDLSINSLTGSIPSQLFTASHSTDLLTVILHTNCFAGSLPSTICEARNLTTLVLDSVSGASACQVKFPAALQSLLKVFVSKRTLLGSTPSCIWSMNNLQTLHLSGNGITGTLNELPATSGLINVGMASNVLEGSIPFSWQQRQWSALDLSGNKLNGLLSPDFATVSAGCSNMDLTVNRLSGNIPVAFRNASSVNILNGNLFACTASTKPMYDPDRDKYICGSDDFNDSLYLWSALLIVVLISAGCFFQTVSEYIAQYRLLRAEAEIAPEVAKCASQPFSNLAHFLVRCCKVGIPVATGFIGVSLVVYIPMKVSDRGTYSTHSFQYAWTTTVAYLHDILPCTVVIICLYFSSVSMAYIFGPTLREPRQRQSAAAPISRKLVLQTMCLFGVHFAIVIFVNAAYVYILLNGNDDSVLLFVQFILSMFKLAWNHFCVGRVLKRIKLPDVSYLACSTFLLLFTFIAGPLIATFFSETSCFSYVVTGQPAVDSQAETPEYTCALDCNIFTCVSICGYLGPAYVSTVEISVVPSWQYSYQCSSSLLVDYTPVLMYSYAVSGVVVPLLRLMMYKVAAAYKDRPSQTRSVLESFIGDSAESDGKLIRSRLRIPGGDLFNGVGLVSRMCLNLGVLLTFGLASPFVAVAVAVDVLATSLSLMGVVTYRLQRSKAMGTSDELSRSWVKLNDLAAGVLDGLHTSLWMVVVLAGLFWCLFLFDMAGDVYGTTVASAMLTFPTVGLWLVYWGATSRRKGVPPVERESILQMKNFHHIEEVRGPLQYPDSRSLNASFR